VVDSYIGLVGSIIIYWQHATQLLYQCTSYAPTTTYGPRNERIKLSVDSPNCRHNIRPLYSRRTTRRDAAVVKTIKTFVVYKLDRVIKMSTGRLLVT